jgi:hypothetical protein
MAHGDQGGPPPGGVPGRPAGGSGAELALLAEHADRLDAMVDENLAAVLELAPPARAAYADILASVALIAQAARDLAARRIGIAEYEGRLRAARALLPPDPYGPAVPG